MLPDGALFNWWDKAQHALVFAVLMLLGAIAYPSRIFKVAFSLFFYGAVIELLQALTGWRDGDFYNWYADTTGVALIWLLSRIYLAVNSHKTRQLNP